MRIAITGASGFIGSRTVQRASEAGHAITALVRESSRREHIEPYADRFVVGDQADSSCWPELLEDADCIVHGSVDWAPLKAGNLDEHLERNIAASIRLIHEASREQRSRQFIFISSVSVHEAISPRWEGVIDEDHPLRPGTLYGAYKAAVEDHLWTAARTLNITFTVIRPCAVYGIDPRIERSIGYPFIERIRRRKRFDRPGGGKFVHVDDVADSIVKATGNDAACNRIFNLADCYARWADLAQMIADILGMDAQIDFSSPPQSKNVFFKEAARELGINLDRGHEGIRQYLRRLIDRKNNG